MPYWDTVLCQQDLPLFQHFPFDLYTTVKIQLKWILICVVSGKNLNSTSKREMSGEISGGTESVNRCARTRHKRAHSRWNARTRVYASCARIFARIFRSISLKFHKDPSFRWGDIVLFVAVYDLELEIISFSKPPKNAFLSAKICTLKFVFVIFFFLW